VRIVSEWAPPPLFSFDEITLIFWVTVAMALAGVWRARQAPWPSRLFVLPLLVVSFTAYRHVPLLAVAAAPLAALALRRPGGAPAATAPVATVPATFITASLVAALALALSGWPRDLPGPAGAVEHLARTGVPAGRLFNDVRFGGYLALAPLRRPSTPPLPVFVDGRSDLFAGVLGADFLYRLRDAQLGLPAWKPLFEEQRIDWALVVSGEPLAARLRQAGWREVHRDHQATLLLRPR
jgi:hypothetical protein